MKTTQEVRDFAAAKGLSADAALKVGMDEKSREFQAKGGEFYVPIAKV
jgi:phosphomethylpyrimidine synthase